MSMRARPYDVFLSYHSPSRDHAEGIATWLRNRGLDPFLDRWYLAPGLPWPQALEQVLASCRAVAVLIGPGEMGSWQQRERNLALERQGRSPYFPVIPVLLPGADPVLGFLGALTWIDLRSGTTDVQLELLVKSIRGEAPGPELEERARSNAATICPYRGLLYFREEDAPFFFGRDAATQKLLEELDRRSLVALVGPSGAGKSSVVRAGVVPQLRRDRARVWEVLTLVPGQEPLKSLAAAVLPMLEPEMNEVDRLAEVGKLAAGFERGDVLLRDVARRVQEKQRGTERILLVVDQWEELYTHGSQRAHQDKFISEILDAAASSSLRIVLTLRGDYVGRAFENRLLSDRLQGAQVNLGPMAADELAEAVTKPAERVGLSFETGT